MVTFCLHWGQNLSTRDISMCDRHFWCRQIFSNFSKTSSGAGRFFKIWLEQRKPQPKVSPFARQTANRSKPVGTTRSESARQRRQNEWTLWSSFSFWVLFYVWPQQQQHAAISIQRAVRGASAGLFSQWPARTRTPWKSSFAYRRWASDKVQVRQMESYRATVPVETMGWSDDGCQGTDGMPCATQIHLDKFSGFRLWFQIFMRPENLYRTICDPAHSLAPQACLSTPSNQTGLLAIGLVVQWVCLIDTARSR